MKALSEQEKSTLYSTLRQVIYLALEVLMVVGLWKIAHESGQAATPEYGIMEHLQQGLLLVIAVVFGVLAWRSCNHRTLLLLFAALILAAFIRENDAFFDEWVPVISWKFCWLFPLAAIWYALRHRDETRESVMYFLHTRAFYMMLTSMSIIIPAAQCVGHRKFLQDLIADPNVNYIIVRRALEEPLELLGYFIILLAAIECGFELLPQKNKS